MTISTNSPFWLPFSIAIVAVICLYIAIIRFEITSRRGTPEDTPYNTPNAHTNDKELADAINPKSPNFCAYTYEHSKHATSQKEIDDTLPENLGSGDGIFYLARWDDKSDGQTQRCVEQHDDYDVEAQQHAQDMEYLHTQHAYLARRNRETRVFAFFTGVVWGLALTAVVRMLRTELRLLILTMALWAAKAAGRAGVVEVVARGL